MTTIHDLTSDELVTDQTNTQSGQAMAWEAIWDWAATNGLPEHSFQRREIYDELNGPQMLAQWVTDLQSSVSAGDTAINQLELGLSATEEESEKLRVQLAGCLTAAEGGISESIVAKQGDYGWSLAYQKVLVLRMAFENLRAGLVAVSPPEGEQQRTGNSLEMNGNPPCYETFDCNAGSHADCCPSSSEAEPSTVDALRRHAEALVNSGKPFSSNLLLDAADELCALQQLRDNWLDEIRQIHRIINWHGHTTAMKRLEKIMGEA